ncbi:unnamed protein product [Paramecium primaurelia]|uniref:COMM domain-containing protein n=1 Tax=Paramecium primaurelia TaxID=5886 RepID=A0A8S1QFP7_PARPR|nr:unnamed protein product [Paramecium primaurelia]
MQNYVYDIDSIRGLNLSLKVPLSLFAYMVDEIYKFTLSYQSAFSLQSMLQIFQRESVALDIQEGEFCINSYVYLIRFVQKNNITAEHLSKWLKENTLVQDDHREYLMKVLKGFDPETVKKVLSLGKLKELKWTVNQYNGDVKYPNLKKLYILLEFHIQDEKGNLQKQIINLTIQEFKMLQMEFKEIGDILRSFM